MNTCIYIVWMQVKVGPQYPFLKYCEKRRILGTSIEWDHKKPEEPLHITLKTLLSIKNRLCSNAIDAESKLEFCSSSSAMVASQYERNILDQDEKDLNISEIWASGTNKHYWDGENSVFSSGMLILCFLFWNTFY